MIDGILQNVVLTLIWSVIGIVIFGLAFVVLDWLTPGSLWKEILEKHNTALAILVGSFAIAFAIIIAATVA